MKRTLARLVLTLALTALIPQAALAGVYVNPSLNLYNTVDKVWPKCFYKYLTVDLGYRNERMDLSFSLNWLDYVDVMTAYRIAFPYHLKGTWHLSGENTIELSALSVNPASDLIEPANMLEARYTHTFALAGGIRLDACGMLRAYPDEGWTLSVSPGATVKKDLGGTKVFLALNGLDAKDYTTLSRDRSVVSAGISIPLYGDSRLVAGLNTLLGPDTPTNTP